MYKTVLKKRSGTITRRNISPRTDDEEPHTPVILQAPKVAFNIVYPPMNFSRVLNVLARTIVGAKNWNYIEDDSVNAVANWAYDVSEATINVDVNNFNYGDTVEISSGVHDYPSTILVNTNLKCDADIPRLAVTNIVELDSLSPVAFATSLNGSAESIDTYSVITDDWSLRIYSQEKEEFIYDTDMFDTITSVQVIGNTFWCTCPTYYFDANTETNYSLIKGTINYNSTTHVYTISYEYYFSTVSAKKVCLSTTQYNYENIGNWIGILTTSNTMYVSNNNGTNWYDIESLSDDYTWNSLSISSEGYALVVGNQKIQFIDISDDDDLTDNIGYLAPENWTSCCLQTVSEVLSLVVASETSVYTSFSMWSENMRWKRLPINDLINDVHTVFFTESEIPVYTISTKNYLYYINTNNDVTYPVKYGFNGNYLLTSFNWQTGIYSVVQTPTDWNNDVTIQEFFILALEETYFSVEGGLYVWGNTNLNLRRDTSGDFNLKAVKDTTSTVLALPSFSNIINPLTPLTLFTNGEPPNYRVPLETQPERTLRPNAALEKHTNIVIPTVGKFVKPTTSTDVQLVPRAKKSNIQDILHKFNKN